MKSKNISYSPGLDQLRFLAVSLVIAFHVYHFFFQQWKPNPDAAWAAPIIEGHTGVALFFTLSGFLFMLIALNGKIEYKKFIFNRILRVFPLFILIFYFSLMLNRDNFQAYDVLYLFFTNIGSPSTSDFFVTGPAWTISVEFTFYLIFPFIAKFFIEKGFGYIVGLIAVLYFLKLTAFVIVDDPIHVFYSTLLGRLDQFLIGMCAARIYLIHHEAISRYAIYIVILGSAFLYGALWYLALEASWAGENRNHPFWIVWSSVESLGWSIFIVGYLGVKEFKSKIFVIFNKAICFLGKISFSLYLMHASVIYLLSFVVDFSSFTAWISLNFLIAFMVVLFFSVLVSICSFYAIEKPFLEMRKRYIK